MLDRTDRNFSADRGHDHPRMVNHFRELVNPLVQWPEELVGALWWGWRQRPCGRQAGGNELWPTGLIAVDVPIADFLADDCQEGSAPGGSWKPEADVSHRAAVHSARRSTAVVGVPFAEVPDPRVSRPRGLDRRLRGPGGNGVVPGAAGTGDLDRGCDPERASCPDAHKDSSSLVGTCLACGTDDRRDSGLRYEV
jgi:hypothetical protein